ncbi:phage tail protein [Comamonas antarctica]|uniref:Phage tail protein n=1 Tax=Comamonas antarctica TaxID=2743470 RepID=A0A6N1WZE0_9BURK|nr:phage tail protein [Comamonas antarctica]QKV52377.1 phage tail protein [Comamonas antarctica]QKV52636.1 phage tail protein [Comamonas antarctica]
MQLCLGLFVFGLDTASYQDLQRRTSWKHPTQARAGARDASQFMGAGEDTISLRGSIVPEFAGDVASLDELRRMANTGHAWALVEGSGTVYGAFVITELEETKTLFFVDGTPRKVEFSLNLRRVDEDDSEADSDDSDESSEYNSMGELAGYEGISIT